MKFGEKLAQLDCSLGHACQLCPQETTCPLDKPHHNKVLIEARLAEIGQIIIVMANKGGVGKSTITANLAAGMAQRGFRVGVADADIHGPNQSRFFGFAGAKTRVGYQGVQTHDFKAADLQYPVKVGSLAFLLEDDTTPVVWRDSYKHDFIHHLLGSFDWGPLDFLIIDMPPGTGNELITLCDVLEGSNSAAVLVSTAQAVAQMDSLKAARFCAERGLPVIGAVENMAGVICPHCTEEFHLFPDAGLGEALGKMGIDRVAKIPLAPELAQGSDGGKPVVTTHPDHLVSTAFRPLIEAVVDYARTDFSRAVAGTLSDVFAQNLQDEALQSAIEALPADQRADLGEELAALLGQETSRLRSANTGEHE